jgi:thymidylate synthase (FAD)
MEHTPNPEKVVARAAKQCYSAGFVGDDFVENAVHDCTGADIKRIRDVFANGHLSCFEHASFTFAIEGISRACSHQLVRFRVASFSQQSQRYCQLGENFAYVIPPSIQNNPEAKKLFVRTMLELSKTYEILIANGIPAEDARFVAPNATETNIVMTMNARELLHAFSLRCCTHAQWEIRDMFNTMLPMCKEAAPLLFENAGAPCDVKGTCPEGTRSCGKINNAV